MSKRFLLVTTLTTIVQTRLIVPGDIAPFDISTGVTDVEAIIKSNCEYGNSLPFRILEREFSRGSVGTMYKKKKGVEKFLRIHARCCNINTMSKVRLIVGAIEKKKKSMEVEDFLFQFYKFFDGNAEKLVIIDETWKSRILVNSSNFSRQRGRSWYTIYTKCGN